MCYPKKTKNPLSAAVWSAIALLVSGQGFSQPASDTPARLPTFSIEENAPRSDDVTRLPFAIGRTAREGRGLATLMDTFGRAPGVLMQESFGGFEPPRLSIRGSGLQSAPSSRGVAILLDGFPLGLADGSFNSALVEPQVADRIEVFLGNASSRNAPAALGGAFMLITKPEPGPSVTTVRAEAGSFGALRVLGTGDFTRIDTVFRGAAAFTRQDGYRSHSAQERTAIFASARYPFQAGPELTVSVYRARPIYDVPGPLTYSVAQSDPRSVSADVVRDQPRRESATTQVTAQLMRQTSTSLLEGGVSWLHTDDWFRQLQANGISDSFSDDLTFRASAGRRFEVAGGEHFVQATASASRGWRDLHRFANDAGATGRIFGHDGLFATTAALEVEDIIRLRENIAVTAGATVLSLRRDITNRLPLVAGTTDTTEALHTSAVQPHLRMLWGMRTDVAFFVGLSRAVEPPTFDDLLVVTGTYPTLTRRSQRLENQRATTWEIGTMGTRGPLGWDVIAYHGEWSNEILRLADAAGLPRGAVNAGPTRHLGLETSAYWRILDGNQRLKLVATAAWSRFYFENDPLYGRNRLAGAPPHQGSAKLSYEHASGFFSSAMLDWTDGATPVDHAGRMTYPGHVLTHVRVGWKNDKKWTAFFEVKNLFDRQHIASTAGVLDLARNPAATSVFLPGVGRNFTVGLEWKL